MNVNADVVVAHNPDVVAREFEDLAFIMHPDRRELHHLNHTSWFVWGMIDGARTVGELATEVTREYDVAPEQSLSDVIELLQSLLEKDLVRVVGGGSPAP